MLCFKHNLLSRQISSPMMNPFVGMLRAQMLNQHAMRFKSFCDKRRKAKSFKWKEYPCVPSFMKAVKPDPFDYPLQTKEQVRAQLVEEPIYEMFVGRELNNRSGIPLDHPQDGKMLADEQVIAKFNIHKLPMSSLQKERLIFLLGGRYKPETGEFKIKCKQYPTFDQNYKRLNEIIKELFLEALRAPRIDIASIRNPYKKDREKRKLGRTKEERDAKLAAYEKYKEDAHKLHKEEGKFLKHENFLKDLEKGLREEAAMPEPTKEQEREMFERFLKDSGL